MGDEYVYYLGCGDSFMGEHLCQNLNCILLICTVYCISVIPQLSFFSFSKDGERRNRSTYYVSHSVTDKVIIKAVLLYLIVETTLGKIKHGKQLRV